MSRSFPSTTPRLLREPTESEQAQARDMVANRHVDTRESDYRIALATMVNMSAAFEANNQHRGDGEGQRPVVARWQTESPERLPTNSDEAQSGVAEAKEAARIHWQNRRSARA